MRIAFITPEYITEKNFDGGLANHLARVCPALVEMGHEVVVFVTSDRSGRVVQDGVEVRRVGLHPSALFWVNRFTLWRVQVANRWLFQSWALNKACAKLHREKPFDLIQYASFTATGLFRLKGVPAVVRVSSFDPLLQKAYDLPASRENRFRSWMDRAAICRADAVFGPSRLIADVVKKETGCPVEVVEPPFTVDYAGWDDQPYRDQLAGRKYLLFFGTLGVLKGVATIAEILQPLLRSDPDLCFVFIGKDGGYQGRPMIEHVWEKAGPFRGRVHYLGKMPHGQLHPILAHALAVVLPSRIDNLPNTCLEAMALKRVVVGSRGASFEQLIEDGVSGFLCEIDSPENLFEAVQKILGLPAEDRNQIGERAAQRIEELCPENAVAKLIDFYRSVVASK